MSWTPITREEILELIANAEKQLNGELRSFWDHMKIDPQKWSENTHGKAGDGFWVVAVLDSRAIYYNDIEEGFNISEFTEHGNLNEYYGNDDSLSWVIEDLFDLIRFGKNVPADQSLSVNDKNK